MKKVLFFICILAPFYIFSEEIISSGSSQYFIRSIGSFEDNNKAMEQLKLDTNPFTGIEMIGWSAKGLFAYRYRCYLDNGQGMGWVYSFGIINTITDEIIEEDSIELYDPEDESDEISDDLSGEYKTKWNKILEKHNIVGRVNDPVSENFKMDFFDFPINNFNCWFDYQVKRKTNFDENWDDDITSDTVNWKLIIGNNTIQKKISENSDEYKIPFFGNVSGRKILGYYKSPYENRIVVITINYLWYSYSGGYYSVGLDLFGCNMNVGLSR
jgi:hypothetical protein